MLVINKNNYKEVAKKAVYHALNSRYGSLAFSLGDIKREDLAYEKLALVMDKIQEFLGIKFNVEDAVKKIHQTPPDFSFLDVDIELPEGEIEVDDNLI